MFEMSIDSLKSIVVGTKFLFLCRDNFGSLKNGDIVSFVEFIGGVYFDDRPYVIVRDCKGRDFCIRSYRIQPIG